VCVVLGLAQYAVYLPGSMRSMPLFLLAMTRIKPEPGAEAGATAGHLNSPRYLILIAPERHDKAPRHPV
jgi:hypothetical protein